MIKIIKNTACTLFAIIVLLNLIYVDVNATSITHLYEENHTIFFRILDENNDEITTLPAGALLFQGNLFNYLGNDDYYYLAFDNVDLPPLIQEYISRNAFDDYAKFYTGASDDLNWHKEQCLLKNKATYDEDDYSSVVENPTYINLGLSTTITGKAYKIKKRDKAYQRTIIELRLNQNSYSNKHLVHRAINKDGSEEEIRDHRYKWHELMLYFDDTKIIYEFDQTLEELPEPFTKDKVQRIKTKIGNSLSNLTDDTTQSKIRDYNDDKLKYHLTFAGDDSTEYRVVDFFRPIKSKLTVRYQGIPIGVNPDVENIPEAINVYPTVPKEKFFKDDHTIDYLMFDLKQIPPECNELLGFYMKYDVDPKIIEYYNSSPANFNMPFTKDHIDVSDLGTSEQNPIYSEGEHTQIWLRYRLKDEPIKQVIYRLIEDDGTVVEEKKYEYKWADLIPNKTNNNTYEINQTLEAFSDPIYKFDRLKRARFKSGADISNLTTINPTNDTSIKFPSDNMRNKCVVNFTADNSTEYKVIEFFKPKKSSITVHYQGIPKDSVPSQKYISGAKDVSPKDADSKYFSLSASENLFKQIEYKDIPATCSDFLGLYSETTYDNIAAGYGSSPRPQMKTFAKVNSFSKNKLGTKEQIAFNYEGEHINLYLRYELASSDPTPPTTTTPPSTVIKTTPKKPDPTSPSPTSPSPTTPSPTSPNTPYYPDPDPTPKRTTKASTTNTSTSETETSTKEPATTSITPSITPSIDTASSTNKVITTINIDEIEFEGSELPPDNGGNTEIYIKEGNNVHIVYKEDIPESFVPTVWKDKDGNDIIVYIPLEELDEFVPSDLPNTSGLPILLSFALGILIIGGGFILLKQYALE